ncbi:MAG: biotin synthase BioB [Rhodospirillaceae bacterium]|nr:biotin synthase BioB [Rhodospirillaceae bacterium]|tara:strand:- start:61 stop:1062 length:1002 start_codon:yes stop_codon:yes gene_type:complete
MSLAEIDPAAFVESDGLRHDWRRSEIMELFALSFNDLLFEAQTVHRLYFNPNEVQKSRLLSIKTGGCPEDCKYCPQSAHYHTDLPAEKLLEVQAVLAEARAAKDTGASRFCMGAAWRNPKDRDLDKIIAMIKGVKDLGMESCMTLGMLTKEQASRLSEAGLDYYNHNVDTSEEFYSEIITSRTYQDRLDTIDNVRKSGMNVCSGGIVGLGEEREDRAGMLMTLANMKHHPESVPINMLVKVEGTPLNNNEDFDVLEFIRTIAVARILMPKSFVRLSAGRESMSGEAQALCFMAGANSIFCGEKLLTTSNPEVDEDDALFARLGIHPLEMPLNE